MTLSDVRLCKLPTSLGTVESIDMQMEAGKRLRLWLLRVEEEEDFNLLINTPKADAVRASRGKPLGVRWIIVVSSLIWRVSLWISSHKKLSALNSLCKIHFSRYLPLESFSCCFLSHLERANLHKLNKVVSTVKNAKHKKIFFG
jgi:hypothetical protein